MGGVWEDKNEVVCGVHIPHKIQKTTLKREIPKNFDV